METSFNDNNYVIDLGYVKTAADVIYEFSTILENDLVKNKKVLLKLGDIELNQSQLLSIKSLINSVNSNLSILETRSVQTQQAALAMGIIVANPDAQPTDTEVSAEAIEENLSSIITPTEVVPEEKVEDTNELSQDEFDEHEEVYDYSTEEINYTIEQSQKMHDELDIIFDEEKRLEELLDHQPDAREIEKMLQSENEYTEQDFEIDNLPTMYIKQTLRSGQAVNYEGNIVIIGDAHPGCEINAAGDITVWGILSGIAHAGASGNEKARIRALKMNAIQLRIADWYSRRPDSTKTLFIDRSTSFVPEEARVIDGTIVLFKINE